MIEYGHFIGGKKVKGSSGTFGDVFQPMTGEVRANGRLRLQGRGGAAVENAKAAQPAWAATNPQRRARVLMKFLELANRDYDKLADCLAREHGKTVADAKGDIQRGLEVVEFACGIPHLHEGRVHGRRGARHRHLLHAPAAGRGGRHHAVQLPRHDPDVEVRARHRLRQRLHPEAVRARPRRAADAGRADDGGGSARRHPQRRQRRQGGGRRHPRPSRHPGHRLRRLDADRGVHLRARLRLRASACSASAAPRTT